MNNKKVRSYLLAGFFLAYFGLKDIENFNLLYNGVALGVSITAFIMAYFEYRKEKSK